MRLQKGSDETEAMSSEAQEVLKYTQDGWQIHYAPISGGVLLSKRDERRGIPVAPFLELRASGLIEHFDTMRQGHPVFRGRVDLYRRVEP